MYAAHHRSKHHHSASDYTYRKVIGLHGGKDLDMEEWSALSTALSWKECSVLA